MYNFSEFLDKAKKYDAQSSRALALEQINAIEHRLNSGGKGVVAFRNTGAPEYAAKLKKFKFWMDNLFAGNPVPVEMLSAYKPVLDVYREAYPALGKRLDEIPNDSACKATNWIG